MNMDCKYYKFDDSACGDLSVAHTREEASLPPGGTEELNRKNSTILSKCAKEK